MARSLKGFFVLTAIIFSTIDAGRVYLIELTTWLESYANIKMCCLSLSLLEADKTFKVLLDNFLPLCSARINVANVLFSSDLNSIFVYKFYINLFNKIYIFGQTIASLIDFYMYDLKKYRINREK